MGLSIGNIQPSRLVRPLLPHALHQRWNAPIEKVLSIADSIATGTDETAQAQRTALVAFTIRIVSAVIAYVSQVLIARWLGGHEYGVFVWVWVAAVICGGVACIGFPSAVVRFIPQYRLAGDTAGMRGIIFGSRIFSVAAATAIALIGCGLVWLFEDTVSSVYVMPLFLGAICLPMLALAEVQDGVARAMNWIGLALSPTYLVRPCLILAAMASALGMGFDPNAKTALIASIAATWITSVGQMLIMNRGVKREVAGGKRDINMKVWIRVSLPIFLVEGFFTLLTNVDILIAGAYVPPDQVAVYFAAVKTLALVHFVYFAVKAGAAQRYAHYHSKGDTFEYEAFVRDTVKWTFWPSCIMAALLLLVGKYLLMLFGPGFDAGYPLLFILVIGIVARASVGPAESVLNMSGEQNACAAIYGVTLFVNIALNVTLIPVYGLYGAAIATTIAMIFEAAALYSITRRRLGMELFIFSRRPSDDRPSIAGEVR
ncbi:MAG: lipopolysaccharide biosynthesis protein [Pseudomonadota bacterium]